MCLTGCDTPTDPSAGSGSAPAGPTTETCPLSEKACKAEIIEVTFESPVKVCRSKAVVPKPHWQKGVDVTDGSGSKRPAVYLYKPKNSKPAVSVKVSVTESKNVSKPGKLLGTLGGLQMEGTCPVTAGKHTVAVTITNPPDSIQWYRGDVSWVLEVPDMQTSLSLDPTRAELFFVLDTPKNAIYQSKNGVWVEALRLLCEKAGVVGVSTASGAAEKIAQYCHGSHGLKYDNVYGGSHFGVDDSGGSFQLDKYIKQLETSANCYDQAGAMQALCGAVGVDVTWLYLEPFGFIKETNLLGWGACNNPGFGNPAFASAQVVAQNDPKRCPFRNHAFGELAAKALDACAGPHTGTEDRPQYVAASIDDTTTLYAGLPAPYNKPGKASDIQQKAGLTEVV